jgi:hypothetical protein
MRPWLLVILLLLIGCDLQTTDPFEQDVVVESYQIAGEPFAHVRLTRTAPIDGSYHPVELAVREADVTVERIDADGRAVEAIAFQEHRPGVYRVIGDAVVQADALYRLEVRLAEGGMVRAQTHVPASFRLVSASAQTIRYRGEEQLTFTVSPSAAKGRQPAYVLVNQSLHPLEENLTPTYRALFDGGAITLEDIRIGSSPILNEANYDRDLEGNIVIRLPWLAVPFYGSSLVHINVLDDNLYDFLRTQGVQQGGSTLPPGEIPNVIDHVEGGTGLFGSMARVTYQIEVVR